ERIARFGTLDVHRPRHGFEYLHRLWGGGGPLVGGETVVGLHHERLPQLNPEDWCMRGAKAGTELVSGHSLHARVSFAVRTFPCARGAGGSVARPPGDVNGTSGRSAPARAHHLWPAPDDLTPHPQHASLPQQTSTTGRRIMYGPSRHSCR